MNKIVVMRLYRVLGVLEKSYRLTNLDGLHRQVLNAVIDAHVAGKTITNQQIVDLDITSRSSTYRKINDLKAIGFLNDEWIDGVCFLSIGRKCESYFEKANEALKGMSCEDT